MLKKERQKIILNIISENEIETQEELAQKLNDAGYFTTQSTVSRDIKELNLIKVSGKTKKIKYAKPIETHENVSSNLINLFKSVVTSITAVNNLIVVKTITGNAQSAGNVVDKMYFSQVIGSVAGDDTLLVITKSNSEAKIVLKKLKELLV